MTIAANKCDLEGERSVPDAVVAAYAKESGATYFNTSAKTGSGLEQAFLDIAKRAVQKQHEKALLQTGTPNVGKCRFTSMLAVLGCSKRARHDQPPLGLELLV